MTFELLGISKTPEQPFLPIGSSQNRLNFPLNESISSIGNLPPKAHFAEAQKIAFNSQISSHSNPSPFFPNEFSYPSIYSTNPAQFLDIYTQHLGSLRRCKASK